MPAVPPHDEYLNKRTHFISMRISLSSLTSSTSLIGGCILDSLPGVDSRHVVLNHQDVLHIRSIVDSQDGGMELVPSCSVPMELDGAMRVDALMSVPLSFASPTPTQLFVSIMSDSSARLYELAVGSGGAGYEARQLASSRLGEGHPKP